jgi:hypothetical protein
MEIVSRVLAIWYKATGIKARGMHAGFKEMEIPSWAQTVPLEEMEIPSWAQTVPLKETGMH